MVHRILQQILSRQYQVATYTLGVMLAMSVYTNVALYEYGSEWRDIAGEALWTATSTIDWGNSVVDVCSRHLQGGP